MGNENVKHTHIYAYVYICVYVYVNISPKKQRISCFVTTWMDLEGVMLSEKPHRERRILHVLTYMCNLKKLNSEMERRIVVARA